MCDCHWICPSGHRGRLRQSSERKSDSPARRYFTGGRWNSRPASSRACARVNTIYGSLFFCPVTFFVLYFFQWQIRAGARTVRDSWRVAKKKRLCRSRNPPKLGAGFIAAPTIGRDNTTISRYFIAGLRGFAVLSSTPWTSTKSLSIARHRNKISGPSIGPLEARSENLHTSDVRTFVYRINHEFIESWDTLFFYFHT